MDDGVEGSNLGSARLILLKQFGETGTMKRGEEALIRKNEDVFSGKTKLVSSSKAGNSSRLVKLEIANRLVSSSKAVNFPSRRGKKSFEKPTTL